jgi:preprotein translocase subunit SecA
MATTAYPVFNRIRQEQGERIENVVVPLTDGIHDFQLHVGMQKALDTECRSMIQDLEKSSTLQTIDDEWKEHLRELDDLKQSANNAQYEQKDPLLIYKLESFELFGQMLRRINQSVLGSLYKTRIKENDAVSESRGPQRREEPKVQAHKDEFEQAPQGQAAPAQAPRPQAPLVNELKVGRNDPCPCGSGKKFKQCHGQA